MTDHIEARIREIVREEIRRHSKELAAQQRPEKHIPGTLPITLVQPYGDHEPTWTTQQAADFLGIARKSLYNLVSEGKAPKPKKMGRLNAFSPSAIIAYRAQLFSS